MGPTHLKFALKLLELIQVQRALPRGKFSPISPCPGRGKVGIWGAWTPTGSGRKRPASPEP